MTQEIAVIGLGYVGLPVALNFSRKFSVVGYDQDRQRVAELHRGFDRTGQIPADALAGFRDRITADKNDIQGKDVYIILVQTGLDADQNPDLDAVVKAAELVRDVMSAGNLIVLSSTVTIGFTEETLLPILCRGGLRAGRDFDLAFAPERLDTGNAVHTLSSVSKVVAGIDVVSLNRVAELYDQVIEADIVRAPSIKVAEAARLLENSQRDANIAFMNDAAAILSARGLDTGDVLAVARTKWNFLPFRPGLVGGHCVNVHTHYLAQAAQHAHLHPALTTLIRKTNDEVPARIASACMKAIVQRNATLPATVTVMGITYKEDVPDTRGSAALRVVRELTEYGCHVQIIDPYANAADLKAVHGLDLMEDHALQPADAVVVALSHKPYIEDGWSCLLPKLKAGAGVVLDVRGFLPRDGCPQAIHLWRL